LKSLRPPRRKKKSTAEHAEIAELFLGKDKKDKSLYGYGLLFDFGSFGDEGKRMKGEEAENAEETNWNAGIYKQLEYWNHGMME
jgi:hypothetical protein